MNDVTNGTFGTSKIDCVPLADIVESHCGLDPLRVTPGESGCPENFG